MRRETAGNSFARIDAQIDYAAIFSGTQQTIEFRTDFLQTAATGEIFVDDFR